MRAGLCVVAAVLFAAGCSASPGSSSSGSSAGGPAAGGSSGPDVVLGDVQAGDDVHGQALGIVLWVAPRGNVDTEKSPVTVTVPGTVAEVGTSNSTEYALLTNGSLYAQGLGTQGQLGDGRGANSFARPVRVRFPAGVRIASIPADVMPYDSGLAVDTRGNVWGWGDNGGGELCLGRAKLHPPPSGSRSPG